MFLRFGKQIHESTGSLAMQVKLVFKLSMILISRLSIEETSYSAQPALDFKL